jgi:hypothetical protein
VVHGEIGGGALPIAAGRCPTSRGPQGSPLGPARERHLGLSRASECIVSLLQHIRVVSASKVRGAGLGSVVGAGDPTSRDAAGPNQACLASSWRQRLGPHLHARWMPGVVCPWRPTEAQRLHLGWSLVATARAHTTTGRVTPCLGRSRDLRLLARLQDSVFYLHGGGVQQRGVVPLRGGGCGRGRWRPKRHPPVLGREKANSAEVVP